MSGYDKDTIFGIVIAAIMVIFLGVLMVILDQICQTM